MDGKTNWSKVFFCCCCFIYFWLHWVFVAACGLSLVVASGAWASHYSVFVAEHGL